MGRTDSSAEFQLEELDGPARKHPHLRLVEGPRSPDDAELAAAFAATHVPMAVVDVSGAVLDANQAWCRLFGSSHEEVVGTHLCDPDDADFSAVLLSLRHALGEGRSWRGPIRRNHRFRDVRVTAVRAGGRAAGVAAVQQAFEDQEAVDTLRFSRSEVALQGGRDGLFDLDLRRGELWVSGHLARRVGLGGRARVIPLEEADHLVLEEDMQALTRAVTEARDDAPHFEVEIRLHSEESGPLWSLIRGGVLRDQSGRPLRVSGTVHDIAVRKKGEQALFRAAFHDELTRLPNRAFLRERLEHAVRLARLADYPYALLFLDMDRFKLVNDSAGHAVGDELLRQFGKRIRASLRGEDFLARLGGDEFAVLAEGSETEARLLADRIRTALREPFHVGGLEIYASTSIGITTSDLDHPSVDSALRAADTAMYEAKSTKPGSAALFRRGMQFQAKNRLDIESELHRALDNDRFRLVYQPIVELVGGQTVGYEALLRWDHEERGLLHPGHFIEVAEETGLIVDIGKWVLEEACREAARWAGDGPGSANAPWVAVNVAAAQLAGQEFENVVAAALIEANLHPRLLHLELTERSVVEGVDNTHETMKRLHRMGVGLALDDFGTGFSALSYLTQLPFDTLKIDGSFVDQLGSIERGERLVSAIISMGSALGMHVTAERIERPDQLAFLRRMGCDQGQGRLLGSPAPARDPGSVTPLDLLALTR